LRAGAAAFIVIVGKPSIFLALFSTIVPLALEQHGCGWAVWSDSFHEGRKVPLRNLPKEVKVIAGIIKLSEQGINYRERAFLQRKHQDFRLQLKVVFNNGFNRELT